MKQITLNIPDSFYNSFIEFLKHVPEVTVKEENMDDIPEWHKNILNERMEEYKKNPAKGTNWDDFEKELDNA
jgi:hypothetical protein